MRNQSIVLLSIMTILVRVAAHEPQLAGEPQTTPVASSVQDRRQYLEVLHLAVDQSLHDAAKANGGRFTLQQPGHGDALATDLAMLTRASTAVVVGRPSIGTAQLSPDGKMINTYYDIVVSATLKGPSDTVVVLKYPGGTWKFSDGSVADVALAPEVPIVLDREYIFFVRPARTGVGTDPTDAQRDVRVLTFGSQSIFEVAGGRVKSLALSEMPIYRQLHGLDAPAMFQRTRAAISAPQGRQ